MVRSSEIFRAHLEQIRCAGPLLRNIRSHPPRHILSLSSITRYFLFVTGVLRMPQELASGGPLDENFYLFRTAGDR